MDEAEAPAANIWGGVVVVIVEAERIQRQPREGPLPGLLLEDIAQQQAARGRISTWLARVFTRRLIRDATRFMDGCHGWGWRYLNKYTIAGEQTLVLNHYEKILNLVERSHFQGATHGTGEHLVYLRFPTRFHFISRHGNIAFYEQPGLISIRPVTEVEINHVGARSERPFTNHHRERSIRWIMSYGRSHLMIIYLESI